MGVGCHAFLQGIFSTQGSNPRLMSPALAGGFFATSATGKPQRKAHVCVVKNLPAVQETRFSFIHPC